MCIKQKLLEKWYLVFLPLHLIKSIVSSSSRLKNWWYKKDPALACKYMSSGWVVFVYPLKSHPETVKNLSPIIFSMMVVHHLWAFAQWCCLLDAMRSNEFWSFHSCSWGFCDIHNLWLRTMLYFAPRFMFSEFWNELNFIRRVAHYEIFCLQFSMHKKLTTFVKIVMIV